MFSHTIAFDQPINVRVTVGYVEIDEEEDMDQGEIMQALALEVRYHEQ